MSTVMRGILLARHIVAVGLACGVASFCVEGNAGTEVGHGLRRGLIVIGGDVGDFCGVNLIAGTVCVFGRVGWRAGAGLKRGSIVLFNQDSGFQPLPTYRLSGVYELVWLRILARQFALWRFRPTALAGEQQEGNGVGHAGQPNAPRIRHKLVRTASGAMFWPVLPLLRGFCRTAQRRNFATNIIRCRTEQRFLERFYQPPVHLVPDFHRLPSPEPAAVPVRPA
jgi:hypothetical protein